MKPQDTQSRMGRQVALIIAATAVFWVVALWIGGQVGLSQRMLALFDLIAVAGFVFAFWKIYQIWRLRRDNEG
ncbi:DUF5337 domain-containing protein [Roseovarius sp. C7]|uniref:DUF5337 domain-containing protein n=1 Tax=Roseovarius sp. C7 TaxID=3398643 RepID=UPI0039F594D4